MATTQCGIIMGYYGKIWSTEEIKEYATFCKENNYSSFIYGPKMDNYLRQNWKTLYPADQLQELKEIRAAFKANGIAFGIDFSPFDITSFTDGDKSAIQAKFNQLNELEVDILTIGFDDYTPQVFKPVKETIAGIQTSVAEYIKGQSNATSFYIVPTYYCKDPLQTMAYGPVPDNYWSTFGALSSDFNIFWCGSAIIPNGFSKSEIEEMNAIFNRHVTLWDNYPVNDAAWMTKSIANTYAFTGRPSELAEVINGHFANPMLQPQLSKIALMTLPKVYLEGVDYQAQKSYEEACLSVCKDAELANFMIHNVMSFREVSYRPDYGLCTTYMQQTIQLLGGDIKVKQEIEDWLEFVNFKGLPKITRKADQYIVDGSYIDTSTDISFKISANCTAVNGSVQIASLAFTENQTGNLTDIANTNGQLTLESNGPLNPNPHTALGKFVPSGSYQLTSTNIQIEISATCLDDKQQTKQSTISFAASEASNFEDIQNINGVLTIIPKDL